MTAENVTPGDSELPTESENLAGPPKPRSLSIIQLTLLASLGFVLICALVAAAWFFFTEPELAAVAPTTPSVEATPEEQSLGFRGDQRSPSQIIRAARRAQERSPQNPQAIP
mgnify:CR=1 FL=1